MAANKSESEKKGQQAPADDIPLASLEESLLSLENMDRASPEMWPEQIPGVSEFASTHTVKQELPPWRKLTPHDMNYVQKLSALTPSGLIMEVKKLHDMAYQLGLDEAKEMTRGKYLNIFAKRPR